jgi:hypothetical protein
MTGEGDDEAEEKTSTLESNLVDPEAEKKASSLDANPFDPVVEKNPTEHRLAGPDIESRSTTIALDDDHRFESAEALTRDKDQQVHIGPEDYVAVGMKDRSSRATGLGMTQEESIVDHDARMESTMGGKAGLSPDNSAGSDFVEASQSDDKNSTTMESLDTASNHFALEGGNGLNLGQETQDMMMTDDDEGNDAEEDDDEVATIVPTMMTALTGPTQLSP